MLTQTQQDILSFMRQYQKEHRTLNCATLEEIANAVGLNTRSAAQWHVKRLEELGHVERLTGIGYRKYHAIPPDSEGQPDPESPGTSDEAGDTHPEKDPGLRETGP